MPTRPIPKPRIIPNGNNKIKRLKVPQIKNFNENGTYLFTEFSALNRGGHEAQKSIEASPATTRVRD